MNLRSIRQLYVANKYIHLLAAIFAIFLVSPHVDGWHPKIPVVTTLFLLALMLILRALKFSWRVVSAFGIVSIVLFIVQVAVNIFAESGVAMPLTAVLCLVFFFFLTGCIVLMAYKIFQSLEISVDTIAGGIDIYFLLGFLWTFLYYFIYIVDQNAFHFSSDPSTTSFIYFSFSTLTTIGFGDIYPINKWAMIFCSLEGVVGQLYVAVFIARIVGLYTMVQQKRQSQ